MRPGERYEALLRLRTADGELIPPFEFFPAAREAGLMPEIDRRVLSCALDEAQASAGRAPGPGPDPSDPGQRWLPRLVTWLPMRSCDAT